MAWVAQFLAGHGYVAVIIDPQGKGDSEHAGDPSCQAHPIAEGAPFDGDGYPRGCTSVVPWEGVDRKVDAHRSAIDFLTTSADPLARLVDPNRIGSGGHSQSARAVSYLQGIDSRVKAIVAYDNLAMDAAGDKGSRGGGRLWGARTGLPRTVTPRSPALGLAADEPGLTDSERFVDGGQRPDRVLPESDPEVKKTAWRHWREASVPAMELVLAGASHGTFTTGGDGQFEDGEHERYLRLTGFYTLAWFDRWLVEPAQALPSRTPATRRLLASSVLGEPIDAILSDWYLSATTGFGGLECEDLRECLGN